MDFFIILEKILQSTQLPTWKLAGLIFVNGLWIPLFYYFFEEVWEAFRFWTNDMNKSRNRKLVYLAVDVPKDIEQTPAGMEAVFNQLAGAHGTETWWESRVEGGYQEWFSFEIVSLEGYVQYIIQTNEILRDLVEASIYAHYPDAEISEVTDYTTDIPSEWPNDDWNCFGTEYMLAKEEAYPLKTYNEFEDKVRGEFVDPMAGMLEIMSKINKGEQIWYQVLAKPIVDSDWHHGAKKLINKITERKEPSKPKGLLGLIGYPIFWVTEIMNGLLAEEGAPVKSDSMDDLAKSPMFKLTPGERTVLEDVERKMGKLAYRCRIRMFYVAKKDVFSKARGVGGVVGAIKQFNDANKNWLKVGKKSWTKANYWFKKARLYQRQANYYKAYKARSFYKGDYPDGFVLNSEELATIYHFPLASVKAPLLMRTGAKKSEPPTTLPVAGLEYATVDIGGPEPPSAEFSSTVPEPAATQQSGSILAKVELSSKLKKEDLAPTRHKSLEELKAETSVSALPDQSDIKYIEIPDETPSTTVSIEDNSKNIKNPPSNLPIG